MNKYENLEKLKDKFLAELKDAVKTAQAVDDFDKLEDIVEDVFNGIPLEIAQCDYIMRYTAGSWLHDKDQEDMEKVSRFMKQIYEDDVFHLNDDTFCDDMNYAEAKFYSKNKELKDEKDNDTI